MCLFTAAFQVIPQCPLMIFSNRDEQRARPSLPPQIVTDSGESAAWLGGIDGQAGGTWLGINQHALVVAMTNRAKQEIPSDVRSRGLLCRDLLACRSLNEALDELNSQLQRVPYAGFNVLLLTTEEIIVIENGDRYLEQELQPGIHTIANGSLNDSGDLRIQRARTELDSWTSDRLHPAFALRDSKRICSLKSNGVDPGICLTGTEWGTVSSTILGLAEHVTDSFYWYADGPPGETEYEDYSAQLKDLLSADRTAKSS